MNKNIYLNTGYLDQENIERMADKNGINFIIEIGGRQVGKTYGTLKLMLDTEKRFILMRRTQTEVDFICNEINNPFTVFSDHDVRVKRDTKYTAAINENDNVIGSVMALSTIAKIRGFNGSLYSDLVFDEFIPENHVTKIRDEGDAFLNAVVTISGNRELEDIKALRVWLLANANTIASPILSALNIQSKVENMINTGQELSIMQERGIMIILPHSDYIMEKRKKTALLKAVGGKESNFEKMAFENEFAYNDGSNITSQNLQEYIPLLSVKNEFSVFRKKGTTQIFVTEYRQTGKQYENTERETADMKHCYPTIRNLYIKGNVYFSSLVVKSAFIDIFM